MYLFMFLELECIYNYFQILRRQTLSVCAFVSPLAEFKSIILVLTTMIHLKLQNDLKYVPRNVFTQLKN